MLVTRRDIKIIKMMKPHRSRKSNTGRMLAGRIESRILLPSSGGNGNRLKIARETFIINV
jgi:hypothetical protein